ncbi:MAG: carbohydrate ABC transporter permease, partial [Propionibacteriaceae bacterium]|nr:carbohydrate ABC transporter permease [Propionibacteriaceae bacterium]
MVTSFLTRRAGGRRAGFRDWIIYTYLVLGVVVILGPILWAAVSSLKSADSIAQSPPELIPQTNATVVVEGYDNPLPLVNVTLADGTRTQMAQVRRIGIEAQVIDPANPGEVVRVPVAETSPVRTLHLEWANYSSTLGEFNFGTFFLNSVLVTVAATLVTLLITSMAAFALSKYKFRGQGVVLGLIVSQLLIPGTVLLVPLFVVVSSLGWFNSYNALIWPVVATPTGVFLLRQYMLTLPDELLDAARMDGASEWRVFWETVLPLSGPAIAVLAILSVMWRWNDFI